MAGPGAGALPSRPGWDGRVPEGRVDRYISMAIGCPLDGRGVGRDVPGVRHPTCYSRIGKPEKWKVQAVQGQAPGRRYVPCSSGWPASFVSRSSRPSRHHGVTGGPGEIGPGRQLSQPAPCAVASPTRCQPWPRLARVFPVVLRVSSAPGKWAVTVHREPSTRLQSLQRAHHQIFEGS